MYSIFRTFLRNTPKLNLLQPQVIQNTVSSFHMLSKVPDQQSTIVRNLLVPTNFSLVSSCGFKVKGVLKKRCKDCYFVRRQNRLHVICETHPRHKQMQIIKQERNTWILSHATQSKVRPW